MAASATKIGLLQKITNFLGGFFLGFLIFLIPLKILSSIWGAFLGLALGIAATTYALKKYSKDPARRIVAIGILTSIIVIIAVYLLISALVFSAFRGLAG